MDPKFLPLPGTHRQANATAAAQTLAAGGVALEQNAEVVAVQARNSDIIYTLDRTTAPTATRGFVLRESDPPLLLSTAEAANLQYLAAGGAGILETCQYHS